MLEQEKKVFHKRKKLNLQIKKDLQVWLLLRIMGTALLAIGVASILLYIYALTVVDSDYLSFAPRVRRISEVLLPVILASSLTSIVAGLLLALFLPQKIAGPIYRIEQDLMLIRSGDLTKVIKLRDGDILKDVAQSVNSSVQGLRNLLNDVKDKSGTLEEKIANGDIQEIKDALKEQKKCLEQFIT